MIDYAQVCFVIMPFGKKRVDDVDVDFNAIYDRIFVPAVTRVALPEGGQLQPRRTDNDSVNTRDINVRALSSCSGVPYSYENALIVWISKGTVAPAWRKMAVPDSRV